MSFMNPPNPVSNPPRRTLLIINPGCQSGDGAAGPVADSLRAQGLEIAASGDIGALPALLAQHAGRIDCVIAGGGDGTMNAVAPALIEAGLPLGILPLGTANDLARTLGIPTDIDEAIAVIAHGIRHRIDLGRVNGRYFFNIANIGLGVRVKRNMSDEDKQRWKILSYARALLKAIRSMRSFRAEILCDDRQHRLRSIQIAIGNGRHYGGGMTVMENATIDDARFSWYSVKPAHWWELLKLVPLLRSGRFEGSWPVDSGSGSHIELKTRKRMPVTADGELITHTPASFTMCPRALEVFVPADYIATRSIHAA
jgi:diacylglycerol kinase (ATP)